MDCVAGGGGGAGGGAGERERDRALTASTDLPVSSLRDTGPELQQKRSPEGSTDGVRCNSMTVVNGNKSS